ncbi:MAG: S8 family serine peptidase [Acidimicrobiia bacterium]
MPKSHWRRLGVAALACLTVGGTAGIAGATPAPHGSGTGTTPTAATGASGALDTTPADDRLLVTVTPGTSDTQVDQIAARADASVQSRAGTTVVLAPRAGNPISAASAVQGATGVVHVETNGRITAASTPNDTYFPEQWGLSDDQPGGIRAQSAWNGTRGSRDVVVGVLDSGVALNHPDLVGNLWTNRTGVNGCDYGTHGFNAVSDNCKPSDDNGHGTHVAGIVGATGDNGRGVTGVAQRVSLMPLRMLYNNPANGHADGNIADAVQAIDWALAAKAQGVNLRVLQASWGTNVASVALSDAIGRAQAAGVLFVAAAGNGINDNGVAIDLDVGGNEEYPCEDSHTNVICVAATDQLDTLASFSNYGASAVDVAAPGYQITSTVPKGFFNCSDPEYCQFDGTSMAAPFVSGEAADLVSGEPGLSVDALRTRILTSVATPPALSGKVATSGRIDLCRATPNCDGLSAVPPTKPTSVRATVADGKATLTWSPPDSNGNVFTVSGYQVNGPAGTTGLSLSARSFTFSLPDNQLATIRVRAFGSGGTGPWTSVAVRPYAGGFEVDGTGALHAVGYNGKKPSDAVGAPVFSGDLARGVAILPTGTGGYVVDAYGGLHRFRIGSDSPLPATATGGPYWPGWDIVRGVALSATGGGAVLDGFGGLHTFGLGAAAPAGAAKSGPYWSGFDIARGVTFAANGKGGYVVDGYGGLHTFRTGSAAAPSGATGGPYWPGWNIVRGVTLVPGTGGGWVLDGFGGLHAFATTGSKPAQPSASPYWPGRDIARGVDA